jgi:hypothetical protein
MLEIKEMKRSEVTYIISWVLFSIFIAGCSSNHDQQSLDKFFREQLIASNHNLTKVVISDVLTPPVCSRVYAYTNIAAHEALSAGKNSYAGKLNNLTIVPAPGGKAKDYYLPLSSIIAFCTVAEKVVFNSEAVKKWKKIFLQKLSS